ncbi:MAG TPA: heme biosynthesis protein HemY, partial [Pseudorhizobium sp.]|nr:heme biosynthesis protein HemY [Pseudorhizobium sp.]
VLEGVWKTAPHPEIATSYVRARSGDSAVDRLKRAEKLEAMRPNNVESLIAVAEAALDARELEKARSKAEAAARMSPRESIYLLLADIEEADTADQGRIRHWMGQALRAPRDPAWVADGIVSERWLPVSPTTGRIDAFEWKVPYGQLEGPIEEGDLAERAIAELPPVDVPPEPELTEEEPREEPLQPQQPDVKAAPPETPAAAPGLAEKSEQKKEMITLPAAAPNPAKPDAPQRDAANVDEAEEDPFFHRRPDDPGVKDPNASREPSNRLRLF